MSEKPKTLSIVYEKNKNAVTFPVSGAYGGPTPDNGGIVVNFYIDYGTLPHSTQLQIDPNQQLHPGIGEDIKRGDITREIQSTAYMSPEAAILIGRWLIDKGNELHNRRKELTGK